MPEIQGCQATEFAAGHLSEPVMEHRTRVRGGTPMQRHTLPVKFTIVGLFVVLPFLNACAFIPTPEPPTLQQEPSAEVLQVPGGNLVYGLTLAPSGIDPHVDASSELGIPLTSVYDTLIYQDLDGTFEP